MAVVARTATTLTHTTPVTVPASPGTAANVPDGDTFPNGGAGILVMNNTHATLPWTVMVATVQLVDGLTVASRVFTVPAVTIQWVRLGPPSVYGTTTKVTAENAAVKLSVYAI